MIRNLLLRFLITGVSLIAANLLIPGIEFVGGITDLLKITVVFFVANFCTRFVVKLLHLPIEIATLGLINIAVNSATLFAVAWWLPTFRVTSFWFSGLSGSAFVIAPVEIPSFITAVIASVVIGITGTTLYWLTRGS
ncbi:phage holin family protein [candidate division WWE3 bacterium]|nr:phage holin family protein [candidate division WWE3 bacterium]